MCETSKTTAVVSTGAWGTALASIMAKKTQQVICYSRDRAVCDSINSSHLHPLVFQGVKLAHNIKAVNNLSLLQEARVICITTPAQSYRFMLQQLLKSVDIAGKCLLICSKGIENQTLSLLSEVTVELAPHAQIAALSGPNFAKEIIANKPAAATIACLDEKFRPLLLDLFANSNFRPYYSDDLIGVQICGAMKNVIAIAAGIAKGLVLGENAHAALITRSLAEISKIITKKGGKTESLLGLAGIGDLLLTCGSLESRNTNFGFQLTRTNQQDFGLAVRDAGNHKAYDTLSTNAFKAAGIQKSVEALLHNKTIEGYYTAAAIYNLSQKLAIELPITTVVYKALYEGAPIQPLINKLFNRPLQQEWRKNAN